MRYIALLRGINVGGKAAVNMAELKQCFEEAGFNEVQTYINSGNVVFSAPSTSPRQLEAVIVKVLHKHFDWPIKVMVRSQTEIEQLLKNLPKAWDDAKALKCNIIFLGKDIDKPTIMDGLPTKQGIETLEYHPGVLFWAADTSNLGKSNMLKLSSNPIYQSMTVRTINTVRKLYSLL